MKEKENERVEERRNEKGFKGRIERRKMEKRKDRIMEWEEQL